MDPTEGTPKSAQESVMLKLSLDSIMYRNTMGITWENTLKVANAFLITPGAVLFKRQPS